ncbi:TRAP transporter small permease [Devosia sp.]|uniref:TRAP transporter small permease n=1 Tax=Devosia sp. TaxID=1871048 RepID=UPI002735FDB0|nr:TRAP transporter small permease [Devosia sp.]MDP2780605.1 TRAP transporter small permease [Devosia sp.]
MSSRYRLGRLLDVLFAIELAIAMLALFAMMLVVVADVFMRYVFNAPIRGSYDMVGILLVIMVSFGFARVIADRAEIVIDLVDSFVPASVARGLSVIAGIGGGVVLGFIFWAMIGPAKSAYAYGDRSLELNLPVWTIWVMALLGLSGAMLASLRVMFVPWDPGSSPVHGDGSGFE